MGLGDPNLHAISKLTNLTYLGLDSAGGEQELLSLTTLQKLKQLHLGVVAPPSWDFISKLANLEVFCFDDNGSVFQN